MVKINKVLYFFLFIIVNLFFVDNALSFDDNKINVCKKISDSNERLACYDKLFLNLDNDTYNDDNNIDNDNGWSVLKNESKLDNAKNISYLKDSDNSVSDSYGNSKTGTLIVRCKNNSTDVYIAWPTFLGTQEKLVEYRIDNNKIQKINWNSSTSGDAIFSPKPISFLKSLIDAKNLIIRTSTFRAGTQELEFNLNGINKVINDISEYCGWNNKIKK